MDNPLDFQVYTANSMCIEYKNLAIFYMKSVKKEVKFRSEHRQKSHVPFVLQKPNTLKNTS